MMMKRRSLLDPRGEVRLRNGAPLMIYKKNSRALIYFLALASGLGVVALTCGRLDQAPTGGVVLVLARNWNISQFY